MSARKRSDVSRVLLEELKKRTAQGLLRQQKEWAHNLNISEAAVSKRLRELREGRTPTDDEWCIRLAREVGMSDADIRDLLIAAQVERSASGEARILWKQIRRRQVRPLPTMTRGMPELWVLRSCLAEMGFNIALGDLEGDVEQKFGRRAPLRLGIEHLPNVYDVIVKLIGEVGGPTRVPSMQELFSRLALHMNARKIEPRRYFDNSEFAALFVNLRYGTAMCAPIVPGAMGCLLEMKACDKTTPHRHVGTEAVITLSGKVRLVLDGAGAFDLDSAKRDILIYNSEVSHHAESEDPCSLIAVHFDIGMVHKWPKWLRLYERTRPRSA